MNIKNDNIHLIIYAPLRISVFRISVSKVMGMLKGKTAKNILKSFSLLKKKSYLGKHFWSRG